MRLILLNTNGAYSHALCYSGIREAFEQIKAEDSSFQFVEYNIAKQDDGFIQNYKPDFIFLVTPLASGFRVWKKNRDQRVIVYETEGLYESKNTRDNLTYCDYFASVDKRGCEYFQQFANDKKIPCKVYHMPLGFSSNVFKFEDVQESYKSDVCMVGVMFNRRRKVLEDLVPIKDQIKLRVITPKDWVGRIIHKDAIQFLQGNVVSPEEMNKYYCGSKIILCANRDYDPANESGLQSTTPGRVFQETACRRMVMIDNSRPEIHDYFVDGREIVVYDETNPNDLREKVLYYLSHDKEREAIAHNGCARTMSENTWKKRIENLLKFVKENEKQI